MRSLSLLALVAMTACSVDVASTDPNDLDEDGVAAAVDNCPQLANPAQTDEDRDGIGNLCDPCPLDADNDPDGDGLCFAEDNCPQVANPDQVDSDWDGWGDACDPCPGGDDDDGDNVCAAADNCPAVANPNQDDRDQDGLGDACDVCPLSPEPDHDGDGRCGGEDNCPTRHNPDQQDVDNNGQGDACQLGPDRDEDGIADPFDGCPDHAAPGYVLRPADYREYPLPERRIELADDAFSEPMDLGFDFPFFGGLRRQLVVHSNGFVSFELDGPNRNWADVGPLPREGASPLSIFGYWTDLDPEEGGTIRYGVMGEAPDRVALIAWDKVPTYGARDELQPVSMQIALHERGAIEMICTLCNPRWRRNALQGIQNASQNVAMSPPGRNPTREHLLQNRILFEPGAPPDQDGDGLGDLCDPDRDGDGIDNEGDVCPNLANPEQLDRDGNGLGDRCNDGEDLDGDDWADALDNCPRSPNPEQDEICSYLRIVGQVRYHDLIVTRDGLGEEFELKDLAGARVELIGGGRVLQRGETDAEGRYSLEAEWLNREQWQVRALAISDGDRPLRVIDRSEQPALYALSSEPFLPGPDHVVDLVAPADQAVGGAFNIFATVMEAFTFVRRYSQRQAPRLTVHWAPLQSWDCGSCYSGNRIRLGGQEADPDEYDDDVIRHEFAHYFQDRFSASDSPGGSHDGSRTDPLLAYGEGSATFFGSMIIGEPHYIDTRPNRTRFTDLENIRDREAYRGATPQRIDGEISEYLVAPLLWDLYDDSGDGEAHDQLALGEAAMMDILLDNLTHRDRQEIGIEGVDLADVLNAVECNEAQHQAGVAALCEERNFPWLGEDDRDCDKPRAGLPLAMEAVDGELVIVHSQLPATMPLHSVWDLEGSRGRSQLECKALPCATGLGAGDDQRLLASRRDGPEQISFAGRALQAKALGGKTALPTVAGEAVRSYRSR